ncbi:MAG: DUF4280 domain-containing protein [Candidatus Bathyarchaeota archaeon]|nr:DUF4280 domain-containing protein [Candidatus Bathyarchaeota archaeon]
MGGLQCSFGVAPSNLIVLLTNRVNASNKPVATIMDNKPIVNILPFGMCQSMANSQEAAATAAAMGALTRQPCFPAIAAPLTPGLPTVMVRKFPALNATSTCICNWGASSRSPSRGSSKRT